MHGRDLTIWQLVESGTPRRHNEGVSCEEIAVDVGASTSHVNAVDGRPRDASVCERHHMTRRPPCQTRCPRKSQPSPRREIRPKNGFEVNEIERPGLHAKRAAGRRGGRPHHGATTNGRKVRTCKKNRTPPPPHPTRPPPIVCVGFWDLGSADFVPAASRTYVLEARRMGWHPIVGFVPAH